MCFGIGNEPIYEPYVGGKPSPSPDYVDVERGKLVKNVGVIDKSNIEKFTITLGTKKEITQIFEITDNLTIKNANCISNTFAANIAGDSEKIVQGDVLIYVAIKKNRMEKNSVESFVKWFMENNVNILYVLRKSQETDLTTEQVQILKELTTYYPATNISINSEQLDGYTVFNYPISMANGWNYVKQQLNDNRDYIYDMDIQSAEAYVNSEYAVALAELEV